MLTEKLKIFTTFTGIGSPEMALRNIGADYDIVGISEVDRYALLAYDAIHCDQDKQVLIPSKEEMLEEIQSKNIAYNFSTGKSEIPRSNKDLENLYTAHKRSKNYGDICQIAEKELPDFNMFIYSYPCKNISVAGRQEGLSKGSGTQSSLVWECERIIKAKQPKYLLMENVKNLVGKGNMEDFQAWCDILSELGYNSYWKVLNGKNFKVPQNRERVIMVSILQEYDKGFQMPEGELTTTVLQELLEPINKVPEKYYIKKERYAHLNAEVLPHQDIAYCLDACYHKGTSVDRFISKKRRQLVYVGDLDGKSHSNKRIYDANGFSPTLNAMQGGNRQPKMLSEGRVRRLTPLECWRLMGYTDEDFYKAKDLGNLSNTKLYERAGRGIVVPMLEEVFKALLK